MQRNMMSQWFLVSPLSVQSQTRRNKRGFTLIELLVVIAIIAILAAILFPVFARARENARRTSCLSNLKQMSLGALQYTQDYDEFVVPRYNVWRWDGQTFPTLLQPYVKSEQIFRCPSASGTVQWITAGTHDAQWGSGPGGGFNSPSNPSTSNANPQAPHTVSYGINTQTAGQAMAAITAPAETILMSDSIWIDATSANNDRLMRGARHLEGLNVAYLDGHAKWIKNSNVPTLRWNP